MTENVDRVVTTPERTPDPVLDAGAEDVDVIGRVAGGDLAALETLYDRYKSVAYGIALRITADPALAEDVVQDAFLGAWRNAGRYSADRGSVRAWFLSVVHHRAIDALRRRRITAVLPEGDEPPPASMTLPDVWAEVAGRLDSARVRAALIRLSDVQREALELAYWGGLTQPEIAARTSTPLGTVKSRMRLGLLALRRELAGGDAGGPGGAGITAGAAPPATASRPSERPVRDGLAELVEALGWFRGVLVSAVLSRAGGRAA